MVLLGSGCGSPEKDLIAAIRSGDGPAAKAAINAGAMPDVVIDMESAASVAATEASPEMLSILLDSGLDPDFITNEEELFGGESLIELAWGSLPVPTSGAKSSQVQKVELLLDAGATVESRTVRTASGEQVSTSPVIAALVAGNTFLISERDQINHVLSRMARQLNYLTRIEAARVAEMSWIDQELRAKLIALPVRESGREE
jgi:hypothetical protein